MGVKISSLHTFPKLLKKRLTKIGFDDFCLIIIPESKVLKIWELIYSAGTVSKEG